LPTSDWRTSTLIPKEAAGEGGSHGQWRKAPRHKETREEQPPTQRTRCRGAVEAAERLDAAVPNIARPIGRRMARENVEKSTRRQRQRAEIR